MTLPENIQAVEQLGIDRMGFILYPPSPRYLASPPSYLPTTCKRVGVFVNETKERIKEQIERFQLTTVQLHGSESPNDCKEIKSLGVEVIKVFSIAEEKDVKQTHNYKGICDYFLFDTKSEQKGGSGRTFPWEVLNAYHGETPFLLSGGLSTAHLTALRAFSHPQLVGYDLNSCFETAPGIKDTDLLATFLQELKGSNKKI